MAPQVGLVRVRLDPPVLMQASDFNQTLVLSTATIEVHAGGAEIRLWVDANTSTVRVTVVPSVSTPVRVLAWLDHDHRMARPIDAGTYGNGWGGSGGSFCYSNGTVASFVGIFPDALHKVSNSEPAVAWHHRNDRHRADFYNDAMIQQGLADCGPDCWDPLTNRSWGAVLVGDSAFVQANGACERPIKLSHRSF